MAILLREHRLLLLQVPGTASTSLEAAIDQVVGSQRLEPRHGTLAELYTAGAVTSAEMAGFDVVCIVRNHFDMLHAEWHRCRTRWVLEIDNPRTVGSWPAWKRTEIKTACAKDFSDFIRWLLGPAASLGEQRYLYENFVKDCTKVFSFNQISSFVDWLNERTGQKLEMPRINTGGIRPPYWMDYDRQARDIVSKVFSNELGKFNFFF